VKIQSNERKAAISGGIRCLSSSGDIALKASTMYNTPYGLSGRREQNRVGSQEKPKNRKTEKSKNRKTEKPKNRKNEETDPGQPAVCSTST
jgi:hypothetical protein